ncbi:unnamed protein product, partial [Mesorhabditis belari]|uniref:diphthine methyl ester synthase n=1 Tax=Mesorhabditis belari TaxID=2138241 RepID=A0AAF3F513_9BILA
MVFYLIGLGLGDVEDITVKGLNVVRKCKRVYLEAYTSILCYGLEKKQLEEYYGRDVIEADRTTVEQNSDEILTDADTEDVAMLVVGDPFGATTHADLVLRAKEKGIVVKVVHNASIMNAVGCCGLQLYNFGETVSIVMWLDNWEPDSYYDKIAINLSKGLHTLCLLDIKTKEQSVENMMRGRKVYEPARYLTCSEACKQLITISKRKREEGTEPIYTENTRVVGLARVGWDDQKIVSCSMLEMCSVDMGPPLHSLIIPGNTHPLEDDMLATFALKTL